MALTTWLDTAPRSLRIFNPYPGIFAYYDGRNGERLFSKHSNWLDDGAFVLGVASYSLINGDEALIYDAHITPGHAKAIQSHLQGLGAVKFTVVYSHHHNDHIAGASGYECSTFIAHEETARVLEKQRDRYTRESPPIRLVMPTQVYDKQLDLQIGTIKAELHHFNIHTSDSSVLWLPNEQVLLVGDVLEDPVTYISEPDSLPIHIEELQRLAQIPATKILPAHGSPDVIAQGGFDRSFIEATRRYLQHVMKQVHDKERVNDDATPTQSLQEILALDLSNKTLVYHEAYEEVHKSNIDLVGSSWQGYHQEEQGR